MYERDLLLLGVVRPPATFADMEDIIAAMRKVLENRSEVERAARSQNEQDAHSGV